MSNDNYTNENKMKQYQYKASMLIEALPYIQRLSGKTVVIKYGGAAMQNDDLTRKILEDVTLLKFVGMNPILVHGGGPDINRTLAALDVEPHFIDGLRVTDDQTMEVVQMVLAGKINKEIVAKLNGMGASAIGLCGIDGNIIKAEKAPVKNGVDLGNVGKINSINTTLLNTLSHDQYIPVIAPIGVGANGESYNINADTAAGAIAAALKAEKLVFLTDTDGVRTVPDDPDTLLYVASRNDIINMIEDGKIVGGMLPKVKSCLKALDEGVKRTHILNGTIPHPIILEIFTDSGIGTMVTG
ncbi:acetylglutamate kinase [Christensenellaceae bacterium OttesenSCG-928-K19]|nr:acetylglutamate kinase [Christensenellaceae bacterium OttesenSCG-928-K19]